MNKETYEALKDLTAFLELTKAEGGLSKVLETELKQVNDWTEEVAKDYVEEKCSMCGEIYQEGMVKYKGKDRKLMILCSDCNSV